MSAIRGATRLRLLTVVAVLAFARCHGGSNSVTGLAGSTTLVAGLMNTRPFGGGPAVLTRVRVTFDGQAIQDQAFSPPSSIAAVAGNADGTGRGQHRLSIQVHQVGGSVVYEISDISIYYYNHAGDVSPASSVTLSARTVTLSDGQSTDYPFSN